MGLIDADKLRTILIDEIRTTPDGKENCTWVIY